MKTDLAPGDKAVVAYAYGKPETAQTWSTTIESVGRKWINVRGGPARRFKLAESTTCRTHAGTSAGYVLFSESGWEEHKHRWTLMSVIADKLTRRDYLTTAQLERLVAVLEGE